MAPIVPMMPGVAAVPHAAPSARLAVGIVLAVMLAVISLLTVVRSVLPREPRRSESVRPRLAVAGLHAAHLELLSETPLDAPAFAATGRDFDVVGNVGWATAIARAWWPDAELRRIDANPVSHDGTLKLGAPEDGKAVYDFTSKSCAVAAQKRAETAPSDDTCVLRVHVVGAGKIAVSMGPPDGDLALPAPRCSLRQVFAHLDRGKQLPLRPGYHATLEWGVGDREPAWVISAGDGSRSMDRDRTLSPSFCAP